MNNSPLNNLIIKVFSKFLQVFLWSSLKNSQKCRRLYIKSAPKNTLILTSPIEKSEHYIISSNDHFIGHNLYIKGHFDFEKFELALKIIGPEFQPTLLVDIGANIGTICIPAVKRNIFPKAIAIEPEPFNFKLLKLNTILNNVDNKIEIHNIALSDIENEVLDFEYSEDNYGDHRLRKNKNKEKSIKSIQIKTQTLRKYLDIKSIDNTLIWIDTQGFEPFILKGIQDILKKSSPKLLIEFSPLHLDLNNSYTILKSILLQTNYKKFTEMTELNELPLTEENLDKIYQYFKNKETFTDLLFKN